MDFVEGLQFILGGDLGLGHLEALLDLLGEPEVVLTYVALFEDNGRDLGV